MKHFSHDATAEEARDLRLALAWIAAALIAGTAANIFAAAAMVAT